MNGERQAYIDLLRVLAIFFVVFNHTRELGYTLYTQVSGGPAYWGSLSLSILCKIAVPVFFMISGGLLLGRQESLKDLFRRRILRYTAVILVFTFLQYLRILRIHPDYGFHPGEWLRYCLTGTILEPYWFLYAYLSFLLFLPFLRRLAAGMGKREYRYLLALKVLSTLLGLFSFYTGISSGLSFPFLTDLIFYPLIGYGLMQVADPAARPLPRPAVSLAALFLCLLSAVLQAHLFLKNGRTDMEGFCSLYAWMLAALTVLWARRIQIKSVRIRRLLAAAGSCVFGVYLLEDVARNQVERFVPAIRSCCGLFGTALLFPALSVLVCLTVVYFLRKIPFVRTLIG